MEYPNLEQWCNIRQAASHLGMSVAFLRKAVRQRRIPFVRVGSKALRFRKAELDAWMQQNGSSGTGR
jgi:excisionase family DNA binding protein